MSFIQFQDPHGAARLRGTERPWMLGLVHDVAAGVLLGSRAAGERAASLYDLLPRDHDLRQFPAPHGRQTIAWQVQYTRAAQSLFDDPLVTYRDCDIALSPLLLTTAMVLGSDAVKLAARLHGQCEINCWIDGHHRAWLADVIQGGLTTGLYRTGVGWEETRDFLGTRDDSPVVASFGETFPTSWVAGGAGVGGPDADEDETLQAWEELSTVEQWRHGLQALHARSEDGLEIRPDWAAYRFGHELSFLDLLVEDRDTRLDQALGLSPDSMEPAPR